MSLTLRFGTFFSKTFKMSLKPFLAATFSGCS